MLLLILLAPGGKTESATAIMSTTLESKFIDRGLKDAGSVIQPSVDLFFGDYYAGVWSAFEVAGSYDEINLYAGTYQSLHPLLSLDAGFIHYEINGNDQQEPYLGLILEYLFRPSLYLYYNFDLETLFAEGTFSSRVELDSPFDLKWKVLLGTGIPENGPAWSYAQGSLDFVHEVKQGLDVGIGVRGNVRDVNLNAGKRSFLWGGITLDYTY